MTKILTIGLHPGAIDLSDHPGLDEVTLAARIERGEAALRAAGLDTVACLVGADPGAAEKAVRERLSAEGPFGLAMIGAGIRMVPEHTLLFERLINVLAEHPGIRICFNTSPETTIDAIRRWT